MNYLLDTCVISDFVKGEKNTLQRLKSTPPDEVFISSVTNMEIKYGLAINPERAKKIRTVIESLLNPITILPFGTEEAEQAAKIRSILMGTRRQCAACFGSSYSCSARRLPN